MTGEHEGEVSSVGSEGEHVELLSLPPSGARYTPIAAPHPARCPYRSLRKCYGSLGAAKVMYGDSRVRRRSKGGGAR